MYSALNIAKYIIDKCTRERYPVSNLQLQKILYYIQREFLQLSIRMRYHVELDEDFMNIIDPIVEKKRLLNPWDMVSDTHSLGKAWDLIYRGGLGDHQVIPQELIRSKG